MTTNYIKKDTPLYERVYSSTGKSYKYKEVGKWLEFDLYKYRKENDSTAALLVFSPYSTSYLRNVDVDKASVLAAMKIAKNAMEEKMLEESMWHPQPQTITLEQRELLDKLEATGFNASVWSRKSLAEVVEAGMKVLEESLND